ncbi:two-component system response regulator KdpE [Pseudoduganella ginsengisoli]|uniref:Response regulator n=2 Tax=Pseudoduganella ginsengisoli TaxID=1462440 RepID=A0A6L6Q3G7_9BURK|nr:response regulator [Pseudoduganella ginsengisoli]MTW03994.1 response regulator [Pseudoduganella ginsengisoli]
MPTDATILVIEDDADIRRMLESTLSGQGYAVQQAGRGHDGLRLLAECEPVLLLVDLGLPDMDGGELVRKLRAQTAAPIVIVSARQMEVEKVAALDAGADDFVTKPFGMPELLARVRAHVRRRSSELAEPVTAVAFGDVVLDLQKHTVTRAGETVHLTPTEFKLLETLAASEGKVLTHRELLRRVWGVGYLERTHYLRIHMAHLRSKLETNPTQPRHFLTETGIGYRFQP